MESFKFTWDPSKNKLNKTAHGISFEEAVTAFYDPHGLLIHDPEHSEQEDRFILLGLSRKAKLLVVCHCYREADEVVRLISARKADRDEEIQYVRRK